MNDNEYKIVFFHEYCSTCKHCEELESDKPCNECMTNPVNLNSHKPVKWEEEI